MIILITGASRGIGASLAIEFAKEGHTLLLVARNQKLLGNVADKCNANSTMKVAIPIEFDINELEKREEEFLSLVRDQTDKVDIIINNAGYMVRRSFEETGSEDIFKLFSSNVFSPANLIRIMLPYLKKSNHSHVVNITSMAGFQGSAKFKGLSFYSASKAALSTLTECLAEEYSTSGIAFNALALGAAQTEMLAEAFPGYKAPLDSRDMATFIKWFALNGQKFFNGKHIPVSRSTP